MVSTLPRRACALLAVLSVCAIPLRAEPIQYVDQTRTLSAAIDIHQGGPHLQGSGSDAAVGFELFDSAVGVSGFLPLVSGNADATQVSELGLDYITAFGSANAVVSADLEGSGQADGSSILSVSFALAESSGFSLDGLISFLAVDPGLAEIGVDVVLSEAAAGVVVAESLSATGESVFSYAGTLEPGEYMLEASVIAGAIGDGAHVARGSFDFELVIPEPATAAFMLIGAFLLTAPRRR